MKRLINPMEMVRALSRGEVGTTAFFVYATVFVLMNVWGGYIAWTDLTASTPEMFAFAGGETANNVLLIVSTIIYLFIPAVLAWGKMSLKEYVRYFVCIDMPLMVLYFSTIIVLILGTIALFIFRVLPPPEVPTPDMSISLLTFSLSAISVAVVIFAKVYLMKKAIDLRGASRA